MATISLTLPNDGDTIEASDVNTPFNTVAAAINGNLDNTNISAGGLTPANLVSGTGTSWAWQSWVPTWTNLIVTGSSLDYAKYIQIGKTVHFKLKLTLGGGNAPTGSITFSTPVTMAALQIGDVIEGAVQMFDFSASGVAVGLLTYGSTTTLKPASMTSDATYAGLSGSYTSSSIPFAWGNSDAIIMAGTFEAA